MRDITHILALLIGLAPGATAVAGAGYNARMAEDLADDIEDLADDIADELEDIFYDDHHLVKLAEDIEDLAEELEDDFEDCEPKAEVKTKFFKLKAKVNRLLRVALRKPYTRWVHSELIELKSKTTTLGKILRLRPGRADRIVVDRQT